MTTRNTEASTSPASVPVEKITWRGLAERPHIKQLPTVLVLGNSQPAGDKNDPNAQTTIASVFGPCVMVNAARGQYNTEAYKDALGLILRDIQNHDFTPDYVYLDISGNDTALESGPTGQHVPLEKSIDNHEALFKILDESLRAQERSATLIVSNGSPLDPSRMKGLVGWGRSKGASNDNTAYYSHRVLEWATEKAKMIKHYAETIGVTHVVPLNIWDAIVEKSAGGRLKTTSDGMHIAEAGWFAVRGELLRHCGDSTSKGGALLDSYGDREPSFVISLQDRIPGFDTWRSVSKANYKSQYGSPMTWRGKLRKEEGKIKAGKWTLVSGEPSNREPAKFLADYGFPKTEYDQRRYHMDDGLV